MGLGFIIRVDCVVLPLEVTVNMESIYFCPNILISYSVAPVTELHKTYIESGHIQSTETLGTSIIVKLASLSSETPFLLILILA